MARPGNQQSSTVPIVSAHVISHCVEEKFGHSKNKGTFLSNVFKLWT